MDPRSRGTVLVVDDEPTIAEVASRYMRRAGDATDGAQALARAPEERELVFGAFYRGDAADATAGAGLGLAVARAIVAEHGGRIWLTDAGPGTRVRFSLPIAA